MPPKKRVATKKKKRVTQKQKQAQKQVVNIVLGSVRKSSKKRGTPRQSAAPQAQLGRVLEQFVQPQRMLPSNEINPTIVPAPFGQPLVTNPSTISYAPNAQPSIYRNARREAPTSNKVNASFAWSGRSGSMTDALPPAPSIVDSKRVTAAKTPMSDRQVRSVSAAKAVARQADQQIKQMVARSEGAERALMGAADAESFMMKQPTGLALDYSYRTPARTATIEEPSSSPKSDPFPDPSSQGGGVIMEGRSLFKY